MIRIAILLACVLVAPLSAQDPELADIERLAATGRLTDARTSLERWNREHPASARVPGDVRALAAMLVARLTTDPQAAEAAYLTVALSWPTTPHAAEAFLRLGQGLVARAEAGERAAARRAAGYLERLISDYPGNTHHPAALLWLVRAHALAGRTDRACAIARDALEVGIEDADVDDVMRVELATVCEG